MSQIPFVNELGDALEAAIARQQHRDGFRFRRSRRMIVFAALAIVVLGGGGAVAATLLNAGQKLADGRVNCYFNTAPSPALHGRGNVGTGIVTGESAVALCSQAFRSDMHFGNVPPGTLPPAHGFIACQAGNSTVNVYFSDGRPGQCERLGDRPLPATYPAATRQLKTLAAKLAQIQQHRGCESPRTMAHQVHQVLTSLGLEDWQVSLQPTRTPANWNLGPAGTGGICGSLAQFSWANTPKASASLFSNHRVIYISLGPPENTATRIYQASGRLYQETYTRCYTPTSIRTLVRLAFAPTGLQVRFATASVQKGLRYEPASERLYQRGCVRFNSAYPSNDNRYADVLLLARNAPPLPTGRFYPPETAFKP